MKTTKNPSFQESQPRLAKSPAIIQNFSLKPQTRKNNATGYEVATKKNDPQPQFPRHTTSEPPREKPSRKNQRGRGPGGNRATRGRPGRKTAPENCLLFSRVRFPAFGKVESNFGVKRDESKTTLRRRLIESRRPKWA